MSLERQLQEEHERAELYKLKLAKLAQLEAEEQKREALPHLYLHKRYRFQDEFEAEVEKRIQIICACNQVGKSSAAIQRVVDLATAKEKWAEYWPDTIEKKQVPAQWWYLYPSMEVATVEFEEKWKPLLPKDKNDPVYGWEIHLGKGGYVRMLAFKSGINVYFKSYEQSAKNLQSGSVYLMVADEELPVHLLPELQMRVNATKGYMIFVFTATLGQNWWKEVVEDKKRWAKEARVWQVSLYDCQWYADGTPSKWTNRAIEETIAKCTTPAEVQRRVFGRFVRDEGLVFASFDRERHMVPYAPVPNNWVVIAGVDYGSGGNKGHPSSIVVIAVNPERTEAKVIRAWRGEGRVTTCKDVVDEYIKIAEGCDKVDYVYYDFSAKDLATFAMAAGLAFTQADKDRTVGIGLVNTLFKTNRLKIMHSGSDAQYEANILDEHLMGHQLADELAALSVDTPKKAARDDLCDALRYAIIAAGFDWDIINQHGENLDAESATRQVKVKVLSIDDLRRDGEKMWAESQMDAMSAEGELEFWQNQLDWT